MRGYTEKYRQKYSLEKDNSLGILASLDLFCLLSYKSWQNLQRQQTDPSFDAWEEDDELNDPELEDVVEEQEPIGVPPRDTHSLAS